MAPNPHNPNCKVIIHPGNDYTPFVVHTAYVSEATNEWVYTGGVYCRTLDAAMKSFASKIGLELASDTGSVYGVDYHMDQHNRLFA